MKLEICEPFQHAGGYEIAIDCDVDGDGIYCLARSATVGEAVRRARRIVAALQNAERLAEALRDALSGWRYIRKNHGDLYGVAWDRVENAAREALAAYEKGDDA